MGITSGNFMGVSIQLSINVWNQYEKTHDTELLFAFYSIKIRPIESDILSSYGERNKRVGGSKHPELRCMVNIINEIKKFAEFQQLKKENRIKLKQMQQAVNRLKTTTLATPPEPQQEAQITAHEPQQFILPKELDNDEAAPMVESQQKQEKQTRRLGKKVTPFKNCILEKDVDAYEKEIISMLKDKKWDAAKVIIKNLIKNKRISKPSHKAFTDEFPHIKVPKSTYNAYFKGVS